MQMTRLQSVDICPIVLTRRGDGGGKQVEEPEPMIKKGNPRGTVRRGTSAIFQLQTGALNTLTEQQQRLFQTQRYFVPALFSVFGPKVR